jgi:3-hydroxyacyl-CoA dehydrogenase
VFETDDVRMWHTGDDVGILSFRTKLHTVRDGVVEGMFKALEEAEKNFKGLVLWQPEAPFCAGADLNGFVQAIQAARFDLVDSGVSKFQNVNQALRYSYVPTVAAVQGMALGGGCEILMHCDRVVAAHETYAGLVEIGVGVCPAGAGLKELVLKAAVDAKGGDAFPHVAKYFEQVAMAKVSSSAAEAREFGYLRPTDIIVPNKDEILYVAKQEALALYESGYRPPLPAKNIPVLGSSGRATLQSQLINFLKGHFITEHEYNIGQRLASIFCGGEVSMGQKVDENWLLRLERELFVDLVKTEKTKARIEHMLKTGKPLRN